MKKRWVGIMTALAGVLLAGTAQAIVIETNLVIAAGTYSGTNEITTTLSYNGAFFDIVYSLDSLANGSNSFVYSQSGTSAGVGSDADIASHYGTLEGNDGEGMSFTSLVLTNFRPYGSGLEREDISDVKFSSLTFGAVANANDGVDVSFIDYGVSNANQNLNAASTGGSPYTLDLTTLGNYPDAPAFPTDLYIKVDSGQSNNRWSFNGIGVSYKIDTGNEIPIAEPQSFQILPDNTVDITLMGSDFEGSNLTYSVDDTLLIGTLTGATNVWTYTPTTGYEGVDSFTFTVNDGTDESDPATVSITVTNELPVATAQSVELYRNASLDITLASTNTDGPSNLTYTVVSGPTSGTLNTNAGNNVTYTPDTDFAGEDSFRFSTYDGLASSTGATVTITVLNNPPVADPQIILTQPDTAVAVTLTGSDPDDSGVVTFDVVTEPASGTLTGTEPNMIYTPANGFSGVDSFTYSAFDGTETGAVATVSISVSADGFNLSFVDFNQALSDNTLNVGGILADVTGVSTNIGAETNDYIYSVVFEGADVDADGFNDTITFDLVVEAWSFGSNTVSSALTNGPAIATNGTVVVGATNAAASFGGSGWGVENGTMNPGQTLKFTLQNMGLTLTDANLAGTAELTGFTAVQLNETGNSYGHQTIFGVGTGLLEYRWNNPGSYSVINSGEPLYVSQAIVEGPAANPQRWAVGGLDFGVTVALTSAEVPPVFIDVSGSDLVFSWAGGGTYSVLTNGSLVVPAWGVAIPDATSPVIAPIASEPVLFFKLSE